MESASSPTEEQVFVGYRFLIKPLLPLFNDDGRFYILALSQNRVRLLEGTRFRVNEVDLAGVPKNLAEALARDVPERHLQAHPAEGPTMAGGQPTLMFHGHGPGTLDENEKTDLLRYFQKIDHGLQDILSELIFMILDFRF